MHYHHSCLFPDHDQVKSIVLDDVRAVSCAALWRDSTGRIMAVVGTSEGDVRFFPIEEGAGSRECRRLQVRAPVCVRL